MKIRDHCTIDSRGFAVLAICIVGVGAVLVDFLWVGERGSINIEVISLNFAFGGLLLNRILPPREKNAWTRLRILRLVTESLFAIAVSGLIVWGVLYGAWFNFFPLLTAPTIMLAVYLLIKYGFKPNEREGKTAP